MSESIPSASSPDEPAKYEAVVKRYHVDADKISRNPDGSMRIQAEDMQFVGEAVMPHSDAEPDEATTVEDFFDGRTPTEQEYMRAIKRGGAIVGFAVDKILREDDGSVSDGVNDPIDVEESARAIRKLLSED